MAGIKAVRSPSRNLEGFGETARKGVGWGCSRTGWQPAVQLTHSRDRRILSISTGSSLLPPALH